MPLLDHMEFVDFVDYDLPVEFRKGRIVREGFVESLDIPNRNWFSDIFLAA
jgi:hypothetical protein